MAGLLATGTPAGLDPFKARTLIVWGDRDPMFVRTEQDALLALWPRSELKVHAETGHSPQWERPERFVRDLDAFMREAAH
jgi:pimeloyl-ACP methyl ester carboxylesterase